MGVEWWLPASNRSSLRNSKTNTRRGIPTKTPKSFLAHLAKEYCAPTIDDKLGAVRKFETPWNQVDTISTWITSLELLCQKCSQAGVDINKACMVLTIMTNAMKCPLYMQLDNENYEDLPSHSLTKVKAYWVKKYKARPSLYTLPPPSLHRSDISTTPML